MVHISDKNYKSEVLEAKIPVLVDFWAEWCGPYRMLGSVIEEIAKEFENRVKVCKMNIDDNPQTPASLGITAIPTLVFYKNGEVVDRITGAVPKNNIIEKLKKLI